MNNKYTLITLEHLIIDSYLQLKFPIEVFLIIHIICYFLHKILLDQDGS